MNNKSQINSKSQKQHTKFKESVHRGTPYLRNTIKSDPLDVTRFICVECQNNAKKNYSGYCENLRGHLENKQHQSLVKKSNKESECQNAINFLDGIDNHQVPNLPIQDTQHPLLQPTENNLVPKSNDDNMLRFEIVRFLMTHNLSFNRGSDILKLIQEIIKDYEIETILSTKLYNLQMSHIAKDCIGSVIKEKLLENLQRSPFSISMDEGSDKFGSTYLAISARFFETQNCVQPTTRFLGLVEMDDSSTGEVLYQKITEFLFAKDQSEKLKKNFMGVCSDGAGNMISKGKKGVQKGATNRLKKDFPYVIVVHDYSHVFNLIIKKAIDKFPANIIMMINDICSHFSRSPQKKKKLRKIQKSIGEEKILDIIRYVETRWFSLKDCIDRILKLRSSLEKYFEKYGSKKEKQYFNHENILYLHLLSLLLGKLSYYTTFFQGENIQNNEIISTLRESLTLVGDLVVKPMHELEKFSKEARFNYIYSISFDKKTNYAKHLMSLEDFAKNLLEEYPTLKELLRCVSQEFGKHFFEVAQASLVASLKKMKYDLPFDEKGLFDSDVVYLQTFDESKWTRLKDRFINIIPLEKHNDFQEQLKRFKYNFGEIKQDTTLYSIGEVWKRNQSKYSLLYQLSRALMVIPYSSCSLERIFSQCTDIKSIKRNRLSVNTLEACLIIKQESGDNKFGFTHEMLERFNKSNSAKKPMETSLVNKDDIPTKISGMEVEHEVAEGSGATSQREIILAKVNKNTVTQQLMESFLTSLSQNLKRELPQICNEFEVKNFKKVKTDHETSILSNALGKDFMDEEDA